MKIAIITELTTTTVLKAATATQREEKKGDLSHAVAIAMETTMANADLTMVSVVHLIATMANVVHSIAVTVASVVRMITTVNVVRTMEIANVALTMASVVHLPVVTMVNVVHSIVETVANVVPTITTVSVVRIVANSALIATETKTTVQDYVQEPAQTIMLMVTDLPLKNRAKVS